jgi:hypothetical protein
MHISNPGARPRCVICGEIAIYQYVVMMHTRIYLLNQRGARSRLLVERQPRETVSFACPRHVQPFPPNDC